MNGIIKKAIGRILYMVAILTMAASPASAGNSKEPDLLMVASVDSSKGYVGEWLTVSVTLYSGSESVVNISPVTRPDFGSLAIYDMGGDKRLSRVKYKGKEYWSAVVARWCVRADVAGKHTIRFPDFSVGIASTQVAETYWGLQEYQTVNSYKVSVKDMNLKMSDIPAPPEGFIFSGAIGRFEIETWIPEGDIVKDQEAVAMVSVTGQGALDSVEIPQVLGAFPVREMRLKEVNEDRKTFIRDNVLNSELELECLFVPVESGEHEIGKIRFGYFDTKSGKYRYAESVPVKVEVMTDDSSSPASPPVIIGI